jgi:hypothetical protein
MAHGESRKQKLNQTGHLIRRAPEVRQAPGGWAAQ